MVHIQLNLARGFTSFAASLILFNNKYVDVIEDKIFAFDEL